MLFIHPMWDNESQRIGMQKCWGLAYNIHGVGELVGILGLISLFGAVIYMLYVGTFTWVALCVPFGMGILSEAMVQASWVMVGKRGFEYDFEKRRASWIENGKRVHYRYASGSNDEGTQTNCH